MLSELAAQYVAAKAEEARAIEALRVIIKKIQAITGHESEGCFNPCCIDWKVTVKAPLITAIDWQHWETVKTSIPEALWPIETKTVLDEKGVKWLKNNEPEIYAVLAQCLTTNPGAVQISVAQKES